MIKVAPLRLMSVTLVLAAVVLLVLEISSHPSYQGSFAVVFLIILAVALEKIQQELRDLREEIRKQRK